MRNGAARRIVQNCYVVHNLEQGCARFHDLLGIGPFGGGGEVVLGDHRYRGQPAKPIRLRGVFVQSGNLNIELVGILSPGPWAFHDMFGQDEEGMHHAAMFSDDYEAEKNRWIAGGHEIASEFTTDFGPKTCYIDACTPLGHFIELYPENPIIRSMYAQAADAAHDWDGQQLIIPWR